MINTEMEKLIQIVNVMFAGYFIWKLQVLKEVCKHLKLKTKWKLVGIVGFSFFSIFIIIISLGMGVLVSVVFDKIFHFERIELLFLISAFIFFLIYNRSSKWYMKKFAKIVVNRQGSQY